MNPDDVLGMSDEDFLKLEVPPTEETPAAQEQVEATQVVAEAAPVQQEQQTETPQVEQQVEQQEQTNPAPELDADGNPVVKEEQAPATEEPDYKALYEGLIKPLKANGKEIPLQSHEELIQLAQQGANYTRKMQQLAPHRKTLMMLENNNLLDPERLGFLIDLQRKDPTAIQKFLKDSGVNPLDIDTEAEPTYQGGNHVVSDAQVNFQTVLDDARGTEVGMAVLQSIDKTWDQASKELLFKEPSIVSTMVSQHEEGFYTRIVGEMDRQRMLGRLPVGQTWLESYKTVGEQMANAGHFNDLVAPAQEQRQTQQPAAPVATRVITPAKVAPAAAKVAAAAPSRASAAPAKTVRNPLEMSDEEFMKNFDNRL